MLTADLVFVFFLGVGTFFSPCAVALVPSYLAYFAGRTGESTSGVRAALDGLRVGGAAAAGILATFAVLAAGLHAIRSQLDVASATLFQAFSGLGLVVGIAFVGLGVLLAVGRAPSLTLRAAAPKGRTPWSMAAWGILFAIGSMGCSLPLTLALVVRVLDDPLLAPFLVLAYALGLAGILVVLSPVLAILERRAAPLLARSARTMQILAGIGLAAAGLFVIVYYVRAL